MKPNYTYALDSRGFTYLKMGKFLQAIADYDAALKLTRALRIRYMAAASQS